MIFQGQSIIIGADQTYDHSISMALTVTVERVYEDGSSWGIGSVMFRDLNKSIVTGKIELDTSGRPDEADVEKAFEEALRWL
ncbi:MAG: hypothetical protein HC888_04110 [Candidatus Competibacteraceae bacterium]|nr:hypothetical protein [Candidatus Competibacteraceae bacterium]